ncbi:LysR substrate-binding domain-containing protein [Ruegeria sp. AU67]|uniref:LysR substrate-binding domain-containing protein n=1 Tax=Ruegeria sp. AU67 TaxID=2108530 RepID=UPI000D68B5DA|nr:LysR substrate-binding domain-containing protein [Ruegeria sp. AU67]
MRTVTLPVAYMPLVDAAPLIVAREIGFDHAEGVSLDLRPAPSWSSLRDMLAFGHVDAAHLLSPIGWLANSANVARKLADFQQIVVASPDLVEQLGRPDHPERLAAFPFVEHRALPNPLSWKFSKATGETCDVKMNPALRADVTPAIKVMAIEGAGISILPDFFAKREIENGTLIRLVRDWALPTGGIYAVYPPTQFRSAATKRFAEMFAERLRSSLA